MRRRYKIYRGDQLLGYVGFDDKSPCERFEPAEAFHEVEALFAREHELSMRAGNLHQSKYEHQVDNLIRDAERVMDEILAPGVRFEAMEDILCSFECDQLSIFEGRVCWR